MKRCARSRTSQTHSTIGASLLLFCTVVSGQDRVRKEASPDLGQYQADALNSGHYVGALPTERRHREILFFGSRDGFLYAFDLVTRNELWRQRGGYRIPHLPNLAQVIEGSFVGSPLIVDGVVYAGATDGRLYATEALSGRPLWVFTTQSKNTNAGFNIGGQIHGTAVCSGDMLFVGSNFHLFALDRDTGEEIWRENLRMWNASPAVFDGIVYASNVEGTLHAFKAATGELLWKGKGTTTPTIADGSVYVGDKDGSFYAYDAIVGSKKWESDMGGTIGSAAVSDGTVFFGEYYRKHFVALGAKDGRERWMLQTAGNFRSSPTVSANRVYFADDHGTVYCVVSESGSVVWRTVLGDGAPSNLSPTSSPIVWKQKLYVGGSDKKLYCLDARDGRELWTFETAGEVSGTPAVATSR